MKILELIEIIKSIVFIVVSIILTLSILIKTEKDKKVVNILIALLFIRMIFAILRFWMKLPPDMPDTEFYEYELNLFVNNHLDFGVINSRFDVRNYIALNGIIRYAFGNTWMVTVVLNSIVGTIGIYFASNIAEEICGTKAKRISLYLFAIEPTIFLYTNTHLRESIVLITITLAFLFLTKYLKTKNNKYMSLFVIISMISGLFRAVNLLMFIVVGFFAVILSKNKRFSLKKVITICIVILFGLFILNLLSKVLNLSININYINENLNRDLLGGGTLPYLVGERYDNWGDLIIAIPKRFTYFILHPFPWKIQNIKHIIPYIASLYNFVFIILMIGIYRKKRKYMTNEFKEMIIKVIILFVVGVIVYAVAKSESAARHRLQFIWLLPVIVSTLIACSTKNKYTKN